MKKKVVRAKQAEVDEFVVRDADLEEEWESPIHVRRPIETAVNLPADLAARAAILARAHHTANVEEWIARVLRERVELEEHAISEARRDLSTGRAR